MSKTVISKGFLQFDLSPKLINDKRHSERYNEGVNFKRFKQKRTWSFWLLTFLHQVIWEKLLREVRQTFLYAAAVHSSCSLLERPNLRCSEFFLTVQMSVLSNVSIACSILNFLLWKLNELVKLIKCTYLSLIVLSWSVMISKFKLSSSW